MTRRIGLLLLLLLAACAGETSQPGAPLGWGPGSGQAAGAAAIIGSWGFCGDATCAEADIGGWRFAADGTYFDLRWLGYDRSSGFLYCADPGHAVSRYFWDGATLTLYEASYAPVPVTCPATFSGDLATIDCGGLVPWHYLTRVAGPVADSCPGIEFDGGL